MCVSIAPARFTNTTLYAAEVEVGGKVLHVLGYQNTAQNLAGGQGAAEEDWDWDSSPSVDEHHPAGNAMILPFPAVPGTMTEANVVSTEQCPHILKDMAKALRPRTRGTLLGGDAMSFGAAAKSVRIFEHDIYTVVLASDPRLIGKALDAVPAAKRPAINKAIFSAYAEWYPDWPVALCCFNNVDAAEAKPLLWWYEPALPNRLFAPALDGHDGGVPKPGLKVSMDHTVAFGSFRMKNGSVVNYSDRTPDDVKQYLTERVVGCPISGLHANGDFVCRAADVRRGSFEPKRLVPPGYVAASTERI